MNLKKILISFISLIILVAISAGIVSAEGDYCERNKAKLWEYHDLMDRYCEGAYPDAKSCSKYTNLAAMYKERVVTSCDLSCKDTDNRDYYLKGFMQGGLYDSGSWDSCYTDYVLIEYYCEDNEGRKEAIQCPSGCYNGACIKGECDSHELVIGDVINDDGKISVNYKVVGEDNVKVELIIVTPVPIPDMPEPGEVPAEEVLPENTQGQEIVSCPITGGVCGVEVGSDILYCTIHTQCDYPTYEPNTQYMIKLTHETCPGVYDSQDVTPLSSCSDSDGGLNYYEKGTACGSGTCKTDNCYNGNLIEYYCENGQLKEQIPSIQEGYECRDGVIVFPECTDSDGGKDYFVKGVATSMVDGQIIEQHVDVCSGTILKEGYCYNDVPEADYIEYICPNGCQDGACLDGSLNQIELGIYDQAPVSDVILVSDFFIALREDGYEVSSIKLFSEIDIKQLHYTEFTVLAYLGDVVVVDGSMVEKDESLYQYIVDYLNNHDVSYRFVPSNLVGPNLLDLFGSCSDHALFLNDVQNSNGKIRVQYSYRNVDHSDIQFSYHSGENSTICSFVGPSGCGGGSGSPYVTCSADTSCDYPEEMLSDREYYIVIEDTACSLQDTFYIQPVLIEEDLPPLTFTGTLYDDDCGLIPDFNCDVYVAQYELATGGIELVNVGVEVHHGGFSPELFSESINNIAINENMSIDQETFLGNNYYLLQGSEGEFQDFVVVWYDDNKLVAILLHNWDTAILDDDFIENLFISYTDKYPSELEFV